jgi:ADP-ribose pyrophosphatase YjhB (NUDIX family)
MSDNLSIPQVLPAENFVISAGTVCFDVTRSRILLLYHRPKAEYLLPKGRVNAGERFSDAALRETLEESGVTATLLPSPIATLAQGLDPGELNTEPFVLECIPQRRMEAYVLVYSASRLCGAAELRHAGRGRGI